MSVVAKCLINTQYAPDAATALYAAPGSSRTIIDKFIATNSDGSTQTLTIYLVPNLATPSVSNLIMAKSLTAGQTYDFTELQNQILNTGDMLSILASIASKIVIRASGREISL